MSWNLSFDEPIELAKGTSLRNLRDAAKYITGLPKREHDALMLVIAVIGWANFLMHIRSLCVIM